MIKVSASILSADFANLSAEAAQARAGGADYLHIDVMDGLFVPNITIGIPVVESLRRVTDLVLDVHLMIDRPLRYVREFAKAGADIIVFHVEADKPKEIFAAIDAVKSEGKLCGLSLKPATPASALLPYISLLDTVLIMTVEPGFAGQRFMEGQLVKLPELRRMSEKCELSVDGGINADTAKLAVSAGADVLVAGSAVFGKTDRAAAIAALKGR